MRSPNLKKDRLLMTKEINLSFNVPTLNFNSGNIDNYSRLHYNSHLYERQDGKKYYLFEEQKDCTMFIMNCNKDVYDELKKHIELNDSIEIWQRFDEDFQIIPESYRHIEGTGGMDIIDFD